MFYLLQEDTTRMVIQAVSMPIETLNQQPTSIGTQAGIAALVDAHQPHTTKRLAHAALDQDAQLQRMMFVLTAAAGIIERAACGEQFDWRIHTVLHDVKSAGNAGVILRARLLPVLELAEQALR